MTARLGEAAALARLSHPNLVKVHDVGVLDGRPFVAMELVQGTTVAQKQAHLRKTQKEWLRERDGCGSKAECIDDLPWRRVDELTEE